MSDYNKIGFYEFGEVSRNPIPKNILFSHWIKINGGKWISNVYGLCYYKGQFLACDNYEAKQINTNEWISKIKLIKCL